MVWGTNLLEYELRLIIAWSFYRREYYGISIAVLSIDKIANNDI